jgi:hypothetical protein
VRERARLEAEVRRLRAVIQQEHGVDVSWVDEVRRLREESEKNDTALRQALEIADECDRLREQNALLSASLKKQDAELKSVRDEHHALLVRLRLERPKTSPYNGYLLGARRRLQTLDDTSRRRARDTCATSAWNDPQIDCVTWCDARAATPLGTLWRLLSCDLRLQTGGVAVVTSSALAAAGAADAACHHALGTAWCRSSIGRDAEARADGARRACRRSPPRAAPLRRPA